MRWIKSKGQFSETCSKACNYKNTAKKISLSRLNKTEEEIASAIAKSKATKLERYGDENYTNKEKRIETCKRKRENKPAPIKKIASETKLERYGDANYNNRKKAKATKLERYGDENYTNRDKAKQTYKTNMAGVHPEHWNTKAASILNSKEKLLEALKTKTQMKLAAELNVAQSTISIKAVEYGIEITRVSSSGENEIVDWLKGILPSNKSKIVVNTRKVIAPKELDIYLPQYKLAIEYDGLFWHSFGDEESEQKNYHLNKTVACEKQGVQLLHVFENEWIHKREIWKSVIRHKLGLTKSKIYARKCEVIKPISKKVANSFCQENHLQSSCIHSLAYGLFYDNNLVAVMTFGKSRFDKTSKYELLRFCSLLNTSVVGGFSKLFKFAGLSSVVSYANRRWSCGNVYEKNSLAIEKPCAPNYYYYNGSKDPTLLFSRQMFQKHKLERKLKVFDSKLTEKQNMFANGYRIIYDSGNMKYTFNHK